MKIFFNSTADGLLFCIFVKILNLNDYIRLMQNTCLFSMQIGMLQANAQNSIGYMDTVLFLTIRKPSRISINIKN